jgi:hypothetical protein
MINLLSSNLIALPDLPSLSSRRTRRRVTAADNRPASEQHCPREMKRWICRWENEGGAIIGQNAGGGVTSAA